MWNCSDILQDTSFVPSLALYVSLVKSADGSAFPYPNGVGKVYGNTMIQISQILNPTRQFVVFAARFLTTPPYGMSVGRAHATTQTVPASKACAQLSTMQHEQLVSKWASSFLMELRHT